MRTPTPTPTNIIDQLKRDEELRLKPYPDTVGKLTIGYGRNIEDRGISKEESEYMLRNDVLDASHDVAIRLPWSSKLNDARFGVLVNMTVNMGIHGLLEFKHMLAAAENEEYDKAAEEMLASKWATQVGARAQRLSVQFRSGEWQ